MKSKDKKDRQWGFVFLFVSLLTLGGCSKNPQGDSVSFDKSITQYKTESYKKVLVVHSYYPDYGWVRSITRGIRMVLDCQETDLQFLYMDTKRNPNPEWMVQKGKEAIQVIGQWNPDLVITVDDNAQEYVGKILAQKGDVPVVFCGVNTNPQRYGYPSPTVTGVLEMPHFKESVSFLKKILGNKSPLRLAVMSGHSKTTEYAFEAMKTQVESDVEVINWYAPVTWQEWKQTVLDSQSRADAIAVYAYHVVLPDPNSKQSMDPKEVIAWTIENSHIPIVGFKPFASEDGSLCGVLESGLEQGKMAGQLALKILHGAQPSSLEIETGLSGQPMLNLDAARSLGIDVPSDVISQADILVGMADNHNSM
jgi:ABC-type uncharacterized transport system substrate-binding protein